MNLKHLFVLVAATAAAAGLVACARPAHSPAQCDVPTPGDADRGTTEGGPKPFQSSVERFAAEAVDDPDVLAIKQTVYRTSDQSPLVPTIIRASERGKQAVYKVELKVRFDERGATAPGAQQRSTT